MKIKQYLPKFHLFPPEGWMNDPNGLCQLNGIHHIFFQYSPDNPRGANKYWGHYQTKDFINYEFTGCLLAPDTKEDRDGVFSGCAYIEDDEMYIYYTGNVEYDGDYDYVLNGREGNTILVTSKDGISSSEKMCLLKNDDYPDTLSLHVRDPKVFCENGLYYMVLGARTKDDKGCVLLYSSTDKANWDFKHFIYKADFGFMWECPDLFSLEGRQFLSLSPQGLMREEYRFQNIFHSGYFKTKGNLLYAGDALGEFTEWDYGFDFYAPQTYMDEQGRRILIGWMGVSGQEYDHDPTIEEGWQHMLTVPRELTVNSSGDILQNPIMELESLRERIIYVSELNDNSLTDSKTFEMSECYELIIENRMHDSFTIEFCEGLLFEYDSRKELCKLEFKNEALGFGRDVRKIKLADDEQIATNLDPKSAPITVPNAV